MQDLVRDIFAACLKILPDLRLSSILTGNELQKVVNI